jgi:ABC-2 type transport system permease protein
MFASSLTKSATVAFVVGAILCSIPVLIGQYFRGFVVIERLGFDWNLRDFTLGLIPLSNVIYFLSLTVLMLYLNLIVISKRHWVSGQNFSLGVQYFVRTVALAVILVSFGFLCNTAVSSLWTRADLTSEKLYTLDQVTLDTLNKIKSDDRAVTVQAFVSKDVPRKYVNAKKQFVGLLRQFGEYGGNNVSVRFVDVEPNSQEALDAEQSGIEPEDDRSEVGGRVVEQPVYLGATISTSLGDVTLPFVNEDSAIEYELSRSIATTIDKDQQITLGIVTTDAQFAGPEFDGRRLDWCYSQTLTELKKQFKIKYIAAESLGDYVNEEAIVETEKDLEIKEQKLKTPPDVLLVADPSSLDDPAMDNLVKYVEAGHPAILLTDPLPFFWAFQNPIDLGIINAPKQPRVSQQSPYSQVLSSSVMPKSDGGTASKILRAIGVEWDNGAAAWGLDDPHPSFKAEFRGNRWPEYYGPYEKAMVFVRNHGDVQAFNPESQVSNGLKELLMFYPGSIRKSSDSKLNFQPLVSLGKKSGTTPWERLTKTPIRESRTLNPRTGRITTNALPARSQITMDELKVLEPFPQTSLDDEDHILAARITGASDKKLDVIMIADLDFVSDLYYVQQEALGQKLDNIALLQNSIEILAGNEGFVALRNRRATPRTLKKLETVIEDFRVAGSNEQEEAEKKMRDELDAEQKKLDEANKEIQADQQLGFFEKLQRTSQEASEAQRRFDLKKRRLDRELKQTITELETRQQQQISSLENRTRYVSIFAAPLPALLLGIVVLWFRRMNEDKDISAQRRV